MANELKPGTLVLYNDALPTRERPWIGQFVFGEVVNPQTEGEEVYCVLHDCVIVQYPFRAEFEPRTKLIVITPEEASLSYREKIERFLGKEALEAYDRAQKLSGR